MAFTTAESNPLFPKSLKDLDTASVPKPIDPSLFVSPATGSKPGPMNKVDEWTDFIYIGNMGDSVLSAALIISPPESHQGKYGYVLYVGAYAERLQPSVIRQLIRNPFLMATNATAENIAHERKRMVINVPKKLQKFYPEKPEI